MKKRKLRNNRPKALFGEVAAAGIQAAATLAAAGIQARQMASSAKEQANAQIRGAEMQASSIEQTNQNNNQLQQQSQQFIASENEANRQIQRDLQMNLQLQSGALDSEQRRMASRIQVKRGGKVRRSNKGLRDASFPLRAGNLPFRVIDGGGVLPLGQTPEGYDLYEIIGNDHDHYHKTRGGKYKSGVGIEFGGGNDERDIYTSGGKADKVVEGEGNQNSDLGELLLVTPNSGMFISKHFNKGFNPAKAVMAGMHPLQAYKIQEANKNGSSPVGRNRHKATAGVSTNYILPTDYPVIDNIGFDLAPINVVLSRRQLKRGGRVKAANGVSIGHFSPSTISANLLWKQNGYFPGVNANMTLANPYGVTPQPTSYEINNGGSRSNKSFYDRLRGISGNLWGAGITTLGNLGGAWLTSWGANRASKYLSKAYTDSAEILAGAYDKLQGIDMNSLKREDFAAAHYMPVVQSVYHNINPQLENTNREFRRLMRATNAGTLSSAARLSRMANANAAAEEQRSAAYADKANREAQTRLQNTQMINEAAAKNAELDVQARRDYMGHYVDLLKYNNDIANERITGRAQAIADGMLGGAGARATAAQAIGQSWGNAIAGSGQAFGNALAMDAKQRNDLMMARVSATRAGELNYLKYYASPTERNAEVNRLDAIINNPNSTSDQIAEARRERAHITGQYYS